MPATERWVLIDLIARFEDPATTMMTVKVNNAFEEWWIADLDAAAGRVQYHAFRSGVASGEQITMAVDAGFASLALTAYKFLT